MTLSKVTSNITNSDTFKFLNKNKKGILSGAVLMIVIAGIAALAFVAHNHNWTTSMPQLANKNVTLWPIEAMIGCVGGVYPFAIALFIRVWRNLYRVKK